MEGIAKTASIEPVQVRQITDTIPAMTYGDIPVDILRFFNIDMANVTHKDELREIAKWTFNGVETLGEGMKKLRDLEIKLGSPLGQRDTNTRRMKLYNWIRMQQKIDDLKMRQEAISGI